MANMKLKSGELLPLMQEYHVMQWNGLKIGFFGIGSPDWPGTFNYLVEETIEYHDFIEVSKEVLRKLRGEEKVDYVIALTHMRTEND